MSNKWYHYIQYILYLVPPVLIEVFFFYEGEVHLFHLYKVIFPLFLLSTRIVDLSIIWEINRHVDIYEHCICETTLIFEQLDKQ